MKFSFLACHTVLHVFVRFQDYLKTPTNKQYQGDYLQRYETITKTEIENKIKRLYTKVSGKAKYT